MMRFACLMLLMVAGCQLAGESNFVQTPPSWEPYAGKTISLRGTAGNGDVGAIVRLNDGGYIGLSNNKPWPLNVVGRTIDAKGKVVSGQGIRAEKYLLDLESFSLVMPSR